MIWLLWMASTSACVDSATAEGVRLFTMSVCASAPARSNAAAVSYSQLLPGNTGMITRGLAIFAPLYTVGSIVSNEIASTASASASVSPLR